MKILFTGILKKSAENNTWNNAKNNTKNYTENNTSLVTH